jgi:hypothetical protein
MTRSRQQRRWIAYRQHVLQQEMVRANMSDGKCVHLLHAVRLSVGRCRDVNVPTSYGLI